MLFAELKTETGVVSEKQIAWLTALANAHEYVYCWRPSDTDEILALIQDVHSHV